MKDMFKVIKSRITQKKQTNSAKKNSIPEDLLIKCPRCLKSIFSDEFSSLMFVCPHCSFHTRISAKQRLSLTADKNSFIEFDSNLISDNPINFPNYESKIKNCQIKTGLTEAVLTGECSIRKEKCVIVIMDSNFIMASMGSVVGEKITRAFEKATEKNLPVILFTASGGARMQEGIFSLMQMAKTSGAIAKHSNKGLFYCAVLTDPTTGGVTASFASLADVTLAEPKVLIGFAGRRVIEAITKRQLPDDFQSAEFQQKHGFVDSIVPRTKMRNVLSSLIKLHSISSIPDWVKN